MGITPKLLASAITVFLLATTAYAQPAGIPACPTGEENPDVALLLKRTEQMMDGRSSVSTLVMSIKTEAWSRKLKMKVWSKGRDYALIRILEGGPRETGMMTLKREKQLWNYLPQAGRVMKLPSGMLGDSWMASDFTNDDLVGGTSMVDDFTSRIEDVSKSEGRRVWRVTMVPKASATVVWEKMEMEIDRASCSPLVQRFYDEDGALARTMTFEDIRAVGWRHFPMRMSVKTEDSESSTSIVYEAIEFDVDVSDDTFSLHRLQKGR